MSTDLRSAFAANAILRRVSIMVGGTAAAQALALLASPLITRLYGPENYGLLGVFISLVTICGPIVSLAYPMAIVLPRESADARGLARLSMMLGLAACAVAQLGLLAYHHGVPASSGAPSPGSHVLLAPVGVALAMMVGIGNQWLIRMQRFGPVAGLEFLHGALLQVLRVSGGFLLPLGTTLIGCTIVAAGLHAVALAMVIRGRDAMKDGGASPIRTLAWTYRDFPLYRAPQTALAAAGQGAPVLLLASLEGISATGAYVLARSVMTMPINLLGKSVGDVLYPQFNEEAKAQRSLRAPIVRGTLVLAIVGVLPFVLVGVYGPELFVLVFGAEWADAGVFARWLGVMLFCGLINRPAVAAAPILGLQRGLMAYEVLATGSKLAALWAGLRYLDSSEMAVAAYALVGAIAYLFLVAWIVFEAGKGESRHGYA